MLKNEYHFNDLPRDMYVELDKDFRERLLRTATASIGLNTKTGLGKILNTYDEQVLKIWREETRLTINQLDYLRKICIFSVEEVEKSIKSLGIRSDNKRRIYNPKLPLLLKDLVYAYSHLVFDGCVSKRYSYFLAFEKELLDYHKIRLGNFGKIEIKFFEKDKQLYLPHVIIHIIKEFLNPNSFKSLEATIPEELKELAIKDIEIANEIIKAAITDDGWVEDMVSFSVSNKQLSRDVWEISKAHYEVGKFPEKPRERIEFTIKRQNRKWYRRSIGETKKLIIKSLLEKPKSTKELCFELDVRSTSILNLMNGIHCKSQNTYGLKELNIVDILEYRTNTPGERTGKFPIYFIKNKTEAEKFMN
ncbi:MAG: hypothetical protein HY831_00500 [Candidatus Aenigmarchaeota archaeon]|nr:hypothetical protein [Candidatus Aenigmarchaeota archaeon]